MASVRIKHCGITSLDDAELCVDAGAWALGMILWPASPRACSVEEAGRIVRVMRRRVELAGVFVNDRLARVVGVADGLGLTIVQLHGDEGPAYCAEVARRTGAKVIKAVRVQTRGEVAALEPFHTDFHLLDGGGGEPFAWELVRTRKPSPPAPPLILAGGLTAENVGEAIESVGPWAVDVASGTEREPGVKDPERVRAFNAAVAAATPDEAADSVRGRDQVAERPGPRAEVGT
jgi:phosphoribosylanthranilate isomerase